MNEENELVLYTLTGKCYHKFDWYPSIPGKQYVKSDCGLLDSIIWNVKIHKLSDWFTQTKRPCKKCYKK